MRKLDITLLDKYLIDAVISGITDENIAKTVRSAQHSDANELYAYVTLGNQPSKNERNKTVVTKWSTKGNRKDWLSHSWSTEQSRAVKEENVQPRDDKNKSRLGCFNREKVSHAAYRMRTVQTFGTSRRAISV